MEVSLVPPPHPAITCTFEPNGRASTHNAPTDSEDRCFRGLETGQAATLQPIKSTALTMWLAQSQVRTKGARVQTDTETLGRAGFQD